VAIRTIRSGRSGTSSVRRPSKAEIHGSIFLVTSLRGSSWHPRARMSITCHARKSGVSHVSDEDATKITATSRACRIDRIWRTTRHTERRAALHRSRPPADQSRAWQAGRQVATPDTHQLLSIILDRMSRVCYAEDGPVEFKLLRLTLRD